MKRLGSAALFVVAAVVLSLVATGAFADTATVKILNKSKWDIHHFYLSASDDPEWGPDQLGKEILRSGEMFTLTDIECDVWDIKIVDEDGDECILEQQVLCNDDSIWKITDEELLSCEGWK